MSKRFKVRQMEQTPKSAEAAPEASAPKIEKPVARCARCFEPMPCIEHDVPAIDLSDEAPRPKAVIEDTPAGPEPEKFDVPRPGTLEELHARILEQRKPKPEYVPPPPTPRQQARIDEEMAAGRRAVERHAAQAANRPVPVPSRQEAAAEGSSLPVHRPADFDEYKDGFRSAAQTRSKDA
jgi:hypothetical protein